MRNNILLILLFLLVVWGWGFEIKNNTPKCSDPDVISLLKQISYENLEDDYALIIKMPPFVKTTFSPIIFQSP